MRQTKDSMPAANQFFARDCCHAHHFQPGFQAACPALPACPPGSVKAPVLACSSESSLVGQSLIHSCNAAGFGSLSRRLALMRQRFFQSLCAAASLLALTACLSANPYYNPALQHHTSKGFANNYAAGVTKPFGEFVRWRIERKQQDLSKPAKQPTPGQTPDMAAINTYANDAVAGSPLCRQDHRPSPG